MRLCARGRGGDCRPSSSGGWLSEPHFASLHASYGAGLSTSWFPVTDLAAIRNRPLPTSHDCALAARTATFSREVRPMNVHAQMKGQMLIGGEMVAGEANK